LGGTWLTLRQAFRKFSGGPKSRVELSLQPAIDSIANVAGIFQMEG
jgi:hypothetical protein